ncbi:MAG: diguanylate cyclase [Anaerolineales bacterium]|nr:diguanylate cyclase [Anaerolineales bacterium]
MTAGPVLRDPLTGAHSRATLQGRLREEIDRARRYGLPLSLQILDLDHFKSINDGFGHSRGDLVLMSFVERLRRMARDSDLLFRYGGDEFVLLLLHTDRQQARAFANRILDGVQSTPFPGNPALTLTLSIGSASFPDDGHTAEDLFERADRRLYEAKQQGRARVVAEDALAPAALSFDIGSRLMEREVPLARLRQFLDDLPQHKRGLFAISGPPGVGKTWFLSEFMKSARLRGYAVWSIRTRPALRSRVFGALAEAQPPAENLSPPGAGERALILGLQNMLADHATAGLLLAVDNLSDLDRPSLDLLWRVLFAPEIGVVALVYTAAPDSPHRPPPLEVPLQAAVELRPLTPLGIQLWLRTALRWEAPDGVSEWLQRETAGLPARLQQALAYLTEQDLLKPRDTSWEFTTPYADIPLAAVLARLAHSPPHNLPVAVTSFVGREAELALLRRRVVLEPFLTIVGPGGAGKTRLALQVAAELREQFPDGVFFVSLVALTTVQDVISAIAQTLRLAFVGAVEARSQLFNYLAPRGLLLVLDDFDYQLEAGAFLTDLRQAAPRVHLLITSRERLNLPEELVFELRGLPVPPAAPGAPGARAAQRPAAGPPPDYSAEQLFLQSARRAQPDFSLADDDQLYVRRICELVEGMPLGLELAAAWTPLFSVREIANQIERSLDFLATGRPEFPERHRSARAVLDYFWSLLAEDERRRVRGLAVFRGGFLLEAAQAVTDASLFFLSALVDKAFLRKAPSGRYEMQELLRQYAEAKLLELPAEHQAAGDRHCDYFTGFLAQALPGLQGAAQSETVAAISADMPNLRAAWRWASLNRRGAALTAAVPSFSLYYDLLCWYHEGTDVFGRAAADWCAVAVPPPDLPLALLFAAHGLFLHRLGHNVRAEQALTEALALLPSGALEPTRAPVLYLLAEVWLDLGRLSAAREALESAGESFRAGGDQHGLASALHALGLAAHAAGDYAAARSRLTEALELRRASGDRLGQALALGELAALAFDVGDPAQAQVWLDQGASVNGDLVFRRAAGFGRRTVALLAAAQGDHAAARRALDESLTYHQEIGNRKEIGLDLLNQGAVAHATDDPAEAQRCLSHALDLFREAGYCHGEALARAALGRLAQAAQPPQTAAALAHQAAALRLALQIGALPTALAALAGLGEVWAAVGDQPQAAEVLTHALYHPASSRHTQILAARCLSRLESLMPPAEVAAAEDRGRHASFDTLLAQVEPRLPPAS